MSPKFLVPVHQEGWIFLLIAFVFGSLLFLLGGAPGMIGLGLTAWVAYFFRDPPRVTPTRDGLIIAPADGVVVRVGLAEPPPELGMSGERPVVSIFMSVFDVHINRAPIGGTVTKMGYRPGKFLNAAMDKASEDNERQSYRIMLEDGRDVALVQIAGLVARRIVTWTQEGGRVQTGARIGMIRFGSRCDVYFPAGAMPLVWEGQRMIAGETVLADLQSREGLRRAEVR